MATTAIWDIKGRLDKVVRYAQNPDKTETMVYSDREFQGLRDIMDYTTQDHKTEKKIYVTGVNCDPLTARDQMVLTKRRFCKEDGILAFHGYQSFAKGETNSDIAHEIGVKLAQELWGERFEVIVATHLDKGHLHNHFVINSVSFLDGKKYNDCNATYRMMRQASDRLCREHELSVVENPERSRAKRYAEWEAEQEGKPTWRGLIKADVNTAILRSMTMTEFIRQLRDMGYEVKTGVKHFAVRPQDKERFVRLRSLGESYTEEAIRQRILSQRMPERPPTAAPSTVKKVTVRGSFKLYRITWKGLRGLYFHYLYMLRKAQRQPVGQAPFLLREDLRHLDALTAQAKFLNRYGINSNEKLTGFRTDAELQIAALIADRKVLFAEKRHMGTTEERRMQLGKRISVLSAQIKALGQNVKMCDDIIERSVAIAEKQAQIKKQKQQQAYRELEAADRINPCR